MAGQYLDDALNAVTEPPRTLRPETVQPLIGPDGRGQQPEQVRRDGGDARPSLAQRRRWAPDVVEQPDLLRHLLFPDDLLPAGDAADVDTLLVQQRGGLQGGLAAAEHRYPLAFELVPLVMLGAVRHKVGGQPRQFAGNAQVRQEARGDDHLAREHRGFLGELHLESAVDWRHIRHCYILDVGHKSVGEPIGVIHEALN
jgi:hypothetical protein